MASEGHAGVCRNAAVLSQVRFEAVTQEKVQPATVKIRGVGGTTRLMPGKLRSSNVATLRDNVFGNGVVEIPTFKSSWVTDENTTLRMRLKTLVLVPLDVCI